MWEASREQHELDRALTLLAAGSEGSNRDALTDLTIGQRDARLLQLRSLSRQGNRSKPICENFPLMLEIAKTRLRQHRIPKSFG